MGKFELPPHFFAPANPWGGWPEPEQLEREVSDLQRNDAFVLKCGYKLDESVLVLATEEIDRHFKIDAWKMFIPPAPLLKSLPCSNYRSTCGYRFAYEIKKLRPVH